MFDDEKGHKTQPSKYADTHGEAYAPALQERMMIEAELDEELPTTFKMVCGSCESSTAGPRLKQGDPVMTCNQCGAPWRVVELPIIATKDP